MYRYAAEVIKGPWPEAEPVIRRNSHYACLYAVNILRARWPEAEKVIVKNPLDAYRYALNLVGEWPAGEEAIAKDAELSYLYIKYVLDAAAPRARKRFWNLAKNSLETYGMRGEQARDMCEALPPPPPAVMQQARQTPAAPVFVAPANWNRPATIDDIVDAIGKAENSARYPYGVKSIRPPTQLTGKALHDWARKACYQTVYNNFQRWKNGGAQGDFIEYLGAIYAPTSGATDDPRNLNKNWVANVRRFLQQ